MQGSVARVGLWGLGCFFSTNNLQRVIEMIARYFDYEKLGKNLMKSMS
jgi:predicted naringenin-chalcone synthase